MLHRAGGLIINPVSRQTVDGCSMPGLRARKACSASSRGRWIAESGQGHSCPPGSLEVRSSPSPSPLASRRKNRACEQLETLTATGLACPPPPPALLRAYQNDVCSELAALGGIALCKQGVASLDNDEFLKCQFWPSLHSV